MNKFKVGEKVYVPEWNTWGIVEGFSGVPVYDVHNFGAAKEGITVFKEGNNHWGEWMYLTDVQPFIEPKYKVGEKVKLFPTVNDSNFIGEIVKVALNKKLKECVYLVFDTVDGYPVVQREQDVELIAPKKVSVDCCCEEVVELTLAEVCRKLGKNIKIIK